MALGERTTMVAGRATRGAAVELIFDRSAAELREEPGDRRGHRYRLGRCSMLTEEIPDLPGQRLGCDVEQVVDMQGRI